ncbi:MAG TPA: proton-conducting transporter membrane subunit, partial [Anaerolineaceae bacterium]|nr:proton-conducting transporter membrane subunit [Anaerolineaceae bacterium]
IGVAANSASGSTAAVYYLMAYLFTNLAAFGIAAAIENVTGSTNISELRGLNQRSPVLSLALAVAMLSLGGIPPFAGFFGKLVVFTAGIEADMVWLVLVGIVNAVVGLYYYLTVLRVAYQHQPAAAAGRPAAISRAWSVGLVVCIAGILVMGFVLAPWYGLSAAASAGLNWLP